MSKRICYVVPTLTCVGGIIVILEHANRLARRGFDIFFLHLGEGGNIDWFPDNIVKAYSFYKDKGVYPKEVDVLVATGWQTAYSPFIVDVTAKRYVYFVQSDERRFMPPYYLEVDLAHNTYYLPYEYLTEAKWIVSWLKQEFKQEAVYAPNGLNAKIIHQTEQLVPKKNKLRILLEGAIALPYKGTDDAFKAVEGLDAEIWCISVWGKPKRSQRCDRFFERVPFDKMKYIYSSCDVLLKMSRVEGFFGPPLEMMACGGTAVTTRVTGYDEYIVDGYNALTVEIGDHEGAQKLLKRLIEDRTLLKMLKENGRKTAQKMVWEPTIDILEEFYQRKPVKSFILHSEIEEASIHTLARFTEELVLGPRRPSGIAPVMEHIAVSKESRINRFINFAKKLPFFGLLFSVVWAFAKFFIRNRQKD